MHRQIALAVILGATFLTAETPATAITLLHEFAGGPNDGRLPQNSLTQSGSTLFGTTFGGGDNDRGTIFSIQTDGSGFALLHEFAGGVNDGRDPDAQLILSGSTLFGTTQFGGDNDIGTIFSIGADGTGFTLLHEFAGGVNDGSFPDAKLTLSGSTLFGTTGGGGDDDLGTVFSIQTDGSGFTLLHEFAGGASDGRAPIAGLIQSGSTLFGTTLFGGDNNIGTVFSIETDGSSFALLHEFADMDGDRPRARLTLGGSTLFGTTQYGGVDDEGTLFSIGTDGSSFTLLREFSGGPNDGSEPFAELTLSGSTLFGTTAFGGDNDLGMVYSIQTDGSGFTLLHEFAGGASDGSAPRAGLSLSGSTLFSTTTRGGDNNLGTVFSLEIVPEPGTLILVILGVLVAVTAGGLRRGRGRWPNQGMQGYLSRSQTFSFSLVPVFLVMHRIIASLFLVGISFFFAPLAALAVTINTVPVGNVGNGSDPLTGDLYGSVSYSYEIGATEVTNAQYADFLNAKAASDPLGLYNTTMGFDARGGITRSGANGSFTYAVKSNMGNKPVNYVSWYDAIRFANWLHNGQGIGDTETGAYTLLGGTPIPSNALSITRNVGARWFLASENEWYKAAYYQPDAQGGDVDNYWLYPTSSNLTPEIAHSNSVGDISNPGFNVANYNQGVEWNGQVGNVSTVGSAGPLSESFYGTSDQGGNVYEWNEDLSHSNRAPYSRYRVLRGGSWWDNPLSLQSTVRRIAGPEGESTDIGFRVATVPEPSTAVLVIFACGIVWWRSKRLR